MAVHSWCLALVCIQTAAGMRLVHPQPGSALVSDDVIVGIEFMHGLAPSKDVPLWIRFDGPGNSTGEDMVFSKCGFCSLLKKPLFSCCPVVLRLK